MSFLTKLPRDRYNPQAFALFRVDRDGFDLGTAKAMAWMSQLAYETDEPVKIAEIASLWDVTVVPGGIISEEISTVLPVSRAQAVVARRANAVIVVFAGTDPLVLADWITDFDFGTNAAGTAHGFTVAADSVWPTIDALLQAAPAATPVFVTGHSLGGALAVLTASRINAARPGSVRAVYTFGMPRVGSAQFAAAYIAALGAQTFRLVHADDLVPTVAPSFIGFRHVGHYLHCARRGKFDERTMSPTSDSDEPQFSKDASKQLKELLHGPSSRAMSAWERWKVAAAAALGLGAPGMRTDPAGLLIELLPLPLRDHMPDRYIEASS